MDKVTIGGDRLGAGKKQTVEMRNYERSTQDLSYIWRSTMSAGTLVPFMNEVALPGDNFDIDLDVDVKTHPTIGPLFGSYKVQLDVFSCPIRLYQGKLHMNMLNIGMKMDTIKLPQLRVEATMNDHEGYTDNCQINSSCILSYFNIRGLGRFYNANTKTRDFNAIPLLAYWDIYKQYYANKQEELGAVIHNSMNAFANLMQDAEIRTNTTSETLYPMVIPATNAFTMENNETTKLILAFTNDKQPSRSEIMLTISDPSPSELGTLTLQLDEVFGNVQWEKTSNRYVCTNLLEKFRKTSIWYGYTYNGWARPTVGEPKVRMFPLEDIDKMRMKILSETNNPAPLIIDKDEELQPYNLVLQQGNEFGYSKQSTQEGLGLKTYQSDLFNNWISTEWIDGNDGINAITAVSTTGDSFTLDSLMLSRKVYDMLNRIAMSGGSYDDWLSAVYTHDRVRSIENPMYMGGLIKELAFQEVVSNSAATKDGGEQPLGTLAGRGVLTNKNKGGKINIRVDEPSYIMGIISLTPRVDYSQGNKWDVNLQTMDDFHKPALDEIGFQDLITDQMAWWDTALDLGEVIFKSAGKVPAWINYMTNVNRCYGNFADESQQMYMTLNRRYEMNYGTTEAEKGIKDLTTYIDPKKFNNIFADTRLDAQNFWTQISIDMNVRRKMSAKIMPNL